MAVPAEADRKVCREEKPVGESRVTDKTKSHRKRWFDDQPLSVLYGSPLTLTYWALLSMSYAMPEKPTAAPKKMRRTNLQLI